MFLGLQNWVAIGSIGVTFYCMRPMSLAADFLVSIVPAIVIFLAGGVFIRREMKKTVLTLETSRDAQHK